MEGKEKVFTPSFYQEGQQPVTLGWMDATEFVRKTKIDTPDPNNKFLYEPTYLQLETRESFNTTILILS